MNCKTTILFFLLYTFKNGCSSLSTQTLPKYDMTETLRSSINALFENVGTVAAGKFIKQMETRHTRLDYPLEHGILLKEIHASVMGSVGRKFDCNFLDEDLRIKIDHLHTEVIGFIRKDGHSGSLPPMTVNFDDFSIHMSDQLFINISYSKAEMNFNERQETRGSFWHGNSLTDEQKEQLKKSIKSVLPTLVIDTIRNDDQYAETLNKSIFRWPKKDLESTVPDFQDSESQYYYLIREVPFPLFNLKNIVIRGLSNFESLKSDDQLDDLAHVLTIANVRGSLMVDYKAVNKTSSKSSKLDFTADRLVITVSSNKDRVNVEARDYRITRSESDVPLSFDQSAMMVHNIESAIASSLMRFKKVWWKESQSLKKYDNEARVRHSLDGIVGKKGQYDYQISFHNITVKLVSGTPYPQQIHCEFPNSLNITHRINAKPMGHLRLNNEQDSTIDINFHANFTSINFIVANPNNSKETDTCEFQIHPNEDIKVELPPKNADEINNNEYKLKTKLDQTLTSMTSEGFTRRIKPAVCSPFNFCTKSANVFNDYLQSFIKNVMKKCWLIGNPKQ
ncbi:uncharacterized protein LOC135837287 [Planococcus citri]|uniref:uncharacterized protein LOC135837287 n=1 Tax=Planococcus citri TaxID=170843 RepID=UPI0031FA3AD5